MPWKRTARRCARALHSVVLPVPGGPCSSTTRFHAIRLGFTPHATAAHSLPRQLNLSVFEEGYSMSGLVSNLWYRIPFDQSEMSISK